MFCKRFLEITYEGVDKMAKTVIVGGARTPFGKLGGKLSSLTAPKLGGIAIKEALKRAKVEPANVGEVIFGSVLQGGKGRFLQGRLQDWQIFHGK